MEEAQKLKDQGVKIITVVMGREDAVKNSQSKLLKNMASKATGTNKPLQYEAAFEELDSISNALVKEACSE